MAISKINISDNILKKITSNTDGSVDVYVLDWQERENTLHFNDVSALLSFNSIGCELSHLEESSNDDFKHESQKYTDEDLSEMICFNFFSAWSNNAVLKILALPDSVEFKKS
ncbi:hypothetical protein KGP17_20070 [Serratia sp. JSRIV001]|jgi:hypothetical protein|uniref:hypothetical protein n=1 Tax=Serratia TaxID=613 RepID=UPI000742D614|nr:MULTISPECIES: hypothetical protein [Serratia]ALX96332.1 hypothetical protein AV650_23590 [Serratia fonticola]PAA96291.1 hypothetical protein CJJ13_18660 [Serratia fonticola]UAN44714.1 hypothetical protein KGP17_20070 [Serratia sp. JSRIV001]UAN56152.1 hypothetical protein KGP21_21160 [Serratia sp. JSRIV004]UAN61806.1 hypothetical protein KGP16_19730 [Serratia sp. JSRIV006]